jgi:flagellar basal body-associated protein FliL
MTAIILFLVKVLIALLVIAGIFATAIGLITLVQFARTKNAPADSSNRINHIRLWWFALTRPELFTETFPWMKKDELDNMQD